MHTKKSHSELQLPLSVHQKVTLTLFSLFWGKQSLQFCLRQKFSTLVLELKGANVDIIQRNVYMQMIHGGVPELTLDPFKS